ncbi:MAG TPA: PAS domain S-box protein [Cyclobacteriaceae bacterium]|nr:PAS domain S-box protein [Cyclobacteriaceae bacterium]
MGLDPRTIIFINIIGTLLMSIGLLAVSRGHMAQVRGIKYWAIATLIQTMGWMLLGLRGVIPDYISITVANTLNVLSLALYCKILLRFIYQIDSNWMFIPVVLNFIALSYFVMTTTSVAPRIIAISLCVAVLMFASSYILFSKYHERSVTQLFLGTVFAIGGAIMTFRVIYYSLGIPDPNQLAFQHTVEQDISYLTFYVMAVMLTFGFLLICNDKYVAEFNQAGKEILKVKDRLNEAQKLAKVGSWEWEIETNKMTWSEEQYILFGEDPATFEVTYQSYANHLNISDRDIVYKLIRKAVEQKTDYSAEHEITRPDGSVRIVFEQGTVILDDNEKPVRIIGTTHDITERKEAEEKVKETERYFRKLIEYSSSVIILLDERGNLKYQSPRAEKILGYKLADNPSLNLFDFIHPDEVAKGKLLLGHVAARPGMTVKREFRFSRLKGNYVWLEGTITNLLDDPNIKALVCNYHDITIRKKAEEALRQSEERWKFAIEGSNDGIWDWDIATNQVYRSPRLKEILGYNQNDPLSKIVQRDKRVHADDQYMVSTALQQHFLHNTPIYVAEYRALCKDGSYKWILDRGKVLVWNDDGSPARMVGTFTDISERKNAEEALRESESKFRLLAEGAREMICRHTMNRLWTYLSPATFEITGWTPEELMGKDPFDYTHPDDLEWVRQHAFASLKAGIPVYTEFRFLCKDGTYKWLETASRPLLNEHGEVMEMHATSRDIAERKLAEEKHIAERQLLRTIIDNIPINIYVKDIYSRKILANRAEYEFMGVTSETGILGKDDHELFPQQSAIESVEEDAIVFNGHPILEKLTLNTKKDGTETWFLISKIPLTNSDNQIIGLVGISVDITSRKLAQDKIEELSNTKDKFFSIVAHDLKSPLNSLKSFSMLLINHIQHISKDEIVRISKDLEKSVDNTIKMTDNLITWAGIQMKGSAMQMEEVLVNDIISPVYEIYKQAAIAKKIKLTIHIHDNLKTYGDRNQLTFIIRNLINNAIKFTNKEGHVSLTAEPLENNAIMISVSDTGVGISEEQLEKLFSLRLKSNRNGTEGEKGTGLGLMLSYEFIKLNKGTIDVKSQEGVGTTFLVKLPQVM